MLITVCAAYLFLVVLLDGSISLEVFSTSLLHQFPDGHSASERVSLLCVIQLVLGTFTHRTVISAAHGCSCNLSTIHAQKVPKSAALAHKLVRKPIVIVLGADIVEFWNYVCHC